MDEHNLLNDPLQWAQTQASKYDTLRAFTLRNPLTREDLVTVLTLYGNAKLHNERPSLQQLAETIGRDAMTLRHVLKKLSLAPLNGTRAYVSRGQFNSQLFINMHTLGLSKPDMAYFCGTSITNISARLLTERISTPRRYIARFGRSGGGVEDLSYRLSSKIYNWKDEGCTDDMIIEKSEISNPDTFLYAVDHRLKISPIIIAALQLVHPGKEIRTPYH